MPEELKKEDQEPKTETTEQDDFDAAFAEAIGEKPAESEDPNKDQPAAEDPAGEPSGEPAGESVPENTPANAESASTAAPDVAALQQEIATLRAENQRLESKMRSWEGRITAANRRAEEAEARLKELESKPAKSESLPAEDPEELKAFVEEYPDLEKPIRLLAKKVADEIVKERLGTVETTVKSVKQSVSQIQETTSADATAKHLAAITQAHPDWRDIFNRGDLKKWIDTQPSYVQQAMNRVVQDGETQEVIDLFSQYKAATQPKPNPNPKADSADALEAVPASSGGPPPVPKKVDKDDFDAAWDEANKKG